MNFKLENDEQIIYEPKMKIKTLIFIVIMYVCVIACIYLIPVCISIGTLAELPFFIMLIAVISILPMIIPLKIILTNKRLRYRDLLLISHSIDLQKIVSIELYKNFVSIYFDPSRLGISRLHLKLDDRFFKVNIIVQDGEIIKSKLLNSIELNIADNKLNQSSIYKKK